MDAELQERIFSAADELYEENGRQTFPTVDAVRRRSKANMNDVTLGMREWRKAQTVQHSPLLRVPDSLQQVAQQLIVKLWQQAEATAAETLTVKQAEWHEERVELSEKLKERAESSAHLVKTLEQSQKQANKLAQTVKQQLGDIAALQEKLAEDRVQMAELSAQLEGLKLQLAELRQERDAAREENRTLVQEQARLLHQVETLQQEKQEMRTQADQHETRLMVQLTTVRTELVSARSEAEAERVQHQAQRKAAAQEALRQSERLQAWQAERDQLNQALRVAGEENANLRGRLEALEGVLASSIRQQSLKSKEK